MCHKGGMSRISWLLAIVIVLRASVVFAAEDSQNIYHHGNGVGLMVLYSFMSQGQRQFEDKQGGSPVQIGTLAGTTIFAGVFIDYSLRPNITLRVNTLLRTTDLKGSTLVSSGSEVQSLRLQQSFFSFGGSIKYYPSSEKSFWYGAGVELARGRSVNLVMGGDQANLDPGLFPTFVIYQLEIGYDFHIAGKFFILPEIRGGVVSNAKPVILNGEFLLSTAFRFSQ